MKTEKIFLLGALVFAILTFFLLLGCIEDNGGGKPIGGDKDANGCLIAAGYSFDSDIGACIRVWGLDQNQRKAAQVVVNSTPYTNPTVASVVEQECEGCYTIQINDQNGMAYHVKIKNWLPDYSNQLKEKKVLYDAANKRLIYSFEVEKPTPCYQIEKDVRILESYPVQVVINVEIIPLQTFAPCTQVIDPETISGEISIDHKPGSFSVNADGKKLFSISDIEVVQNPATQLMLI